MTSLFKTQRALFFDENGDYLGSKTFKRSEKIFKYKKNSYNIDLKYSSFRNINVIPILWDRKDYYYNIGNSNPVLIDKKSEPIINPELYNIMLETKVARDLNDLSRKGLADFLTPRNILIGLIVVGAIIYFASGGSL